jgi:hypothetical protein
MKRANAWYVLIAMALLIAAPAAVALAGTVDMQPAPTFMGHAYYDLTTGNTTWEVGPGDQASTPFADVDVYKNTANAPLGGIASTDFTSIWGDQVTTTSTGILDQNDFTVVNAAGGPLLTVSCNITLIDGGSNTALGGYTTGVINFGAGLPVNNYATITVSGLAALNINLTTTNIIMIQSIASHTGACSSAGVAVLNPPPTVGTGSAAMYINSSTIGPAGFYTLNGVPEADPGYRIAVLQPVPTKATTWGGLKGQYH